MKRSTASARLTPLCWEPSRKRNDTVPASASSPPAMTTNGILSLDAVRIFLGKRSEEVSTSTRIPRSRRDWANSSR